MDRSTGPREHHRNNAESTSSVCPRNGLQYVAGNDIHRHCGRSSDRDRCRSDHHLLLLQEEDDPTTGRRRRR